MTIQERSTPAVAEAKPTPLERFLALSGTSRAKAYPRGYRMLCPAHQDTEESLMFWDYESDGHVAVFCWANCQRADVCAALGLRESDLYNDARPPRPGPERKLDLLDLALDKLIHPGLLLSVDVEDCYTWKPESRSAVRGWWAFSISWRTVPHTAGIASAQRKRVSWKALDRSMEKTKKTNLVVQDGYPTPPGFGAKQARLTQSEQAREKRNHSLYSIANDYKKYLETTMPTGWTEKGTPRCMLEQRLTSRSKSTHSILEKAASTVAVGGGTWYDKYSRSI